MAIDSLPELYRDMAQRGIFVPENGTPPPDIFYDPYEDEAPLDPKEMTRLTERFLLQASGQEGENIREVLDADPLEGREGPTLKSVRSSIIIDDPVERISSRLALGDDSFPVLVQYTGVEYTSEVLQGGQKLAAWNLYQNPKLAGVSLGIARWSDVAEAVSPSAEGPHTENGVYHFFALFAAGNRELSMLDSDDPARRVLERVYGATPTGKSTDPTRGILFEGRLRPLGDGTARFDAAPLSIPFGVDRDRFELTQRFNANAYLRSPEPGVPSLVTRALNRVSSRIQIS